MAGCNENSTNTSDCEKSLPKIKCIDTLPAMHHKQSRSMKIKCNAFKHLITKHRAMAIPAEHRCNGKVTHKKAIATKAQ